jgi:hypothetical protein
VTSTSVRHGEVQKYFSRFVYLAFVSIFELKDNGHALSDFN